MNKREHWEKIYTTKGRDEMSWFRDHLDLSLELILKATIGKDSTVIDVGGGNSTLVDDLLGLGFDDLTVLDISATALEKSRDRLGNAAIKVKWIASDVTEIEFPEETFEVWHDRAVFHFLTDSNERRKYAESLQRSLKPNGHAIVASFDLDGPIKCSSLDVVRYDPESMLAEFDRLTLIDSVREAHKTPFGATQNFIYCHFQKT